MSPENAHKLMGFYMEGLILGVNTMYMLFASLAYRVYRDNSYTVGLWYLLLLCCTRDVHDFLMYQLERLRTGRVAFSHCTLKVSAADTACTCNGSVPRLLGHALNNRTLDQSKIRSETLCT